MTSADYMQRALRLARRALGTTSPNPAVGAVLVRGDRVVGEGFTQPTGRDHAEVVALRQAGDQAQGATLYVTLEPCRLQGRTPPCTQAILQAGVTEVHLAVFDPNPLVAGKGKRELEEGGIRVMVDDGTEASQKLNEAYFKFITTGAPFVTAKFAASLDGKIATRSGESRWITGDVARRRAHKLRAISDAVMVGIGTVLADDPQLTARNQRGRPLPRQPLRVIVDSRSRTPASAKLFLEPGPVLLAAACIPGQPGRTLKPEQAEIVQLPAEDGSVDLKALLAHLGRREVASLLVEGGGVLLGALFDRGLVDKVVAFIAPVIIGGVSATPAVGGLGSATLAEALRLHDVKVERLGEDLMVVGYPAGRGAGEHVGK